MLVDFEMMIPKNKFSSTNLVITKEETKNGPVSPLWDTGSFFKNEDGLFYDSVKVPFWLICLTDL